MSEWTRKGRATAIALAHAGRSGLPSVARTARERADRRFQRVVDDLEESLAQAGFRARVLRRAGEFDSPAWPNDDVLVLVEIATIYHWPHHLDTLLDICRPALGDRIGFLLAPLRDGRLVACRGVRAFARSAYPTDEVNDWPDLPTPLLDYRLDKTFRMVADSLFEASGILASLDGSELHEEEAAALDEALARAESANEYIAELLRDHQELLAEIMGLIVDFHQQLGDEFSTIQRGERIERPLAASLIDGVNGEPDDRFVAYVFGSATSLEWDVDPDGVFECMELAGQELGDDKQAD